MTPKRLLVFSLLGVALVLAWRFDHRALRHAPGVLVAQSPAQGATDSNVFTHGAFTLTPRADFELSARVLSSKRYFLDPGAALAPLDLALGWGPMSDQAVLDRLDVSQSGRWYHLRWSSEPPLPADTLLRHSGNMHMIPAHPGVEDTLKGARAGQVITLSGLLVDAHRDDGWQWRTSLSREDTGNGSCELVWVTRASLAP